MLIGLVINLTAVQEIATGLTALAMTQSVARCFIKPIFPFYDPYFSNAFRNSGDFHQYWFPQWSKSHCSI